MKLTAKKIFNDNELDKNSVVEDYSVTASDGKKYYSNIKKIGLEYENLDYNKSLDFLLMTFYSIDDN